MSIIRLGHEEIDKNQWNRLVQKSTHARIFSDFDYLKAVHPGFEALVEIHNNEYKFAFPLTIKRRKGISYLVQPVFTQQISVLSEDGTISSEYRETLGRLLLTYPSVRLSIDDLSFKLLGEIHGFRHRKRKSFIMNLEESKDYSAEYSKNHRRNIKKALALEWKIEKNQDYTGLLSDFLENKGSELKISGSFEESFKRLIPFFESQEGISVLSATDQNGKRLASALFAGYKDCMTFLLSTSAAEGKKSGIMHALIDQWLENESREYNILDFEGGNIDSLARFYSGFGAEEHTFFFIERHRFPFGLFIKS